jgi:hypothetical protein
MFFGNPRTFSTETRLTCPDAGCAIHRTDLPGMRRAKLKLFGAAPLPLHFEEKKV